MLTRETIYSVQTVWWMINGSRFRNFISKKTMIIVMKEIQTFYPKLCIHAYTSTRINPLNLTIGTKVPFFSFLLFPLVFFYIIIFYFSCISVVIVSSSSSAPILIDRCRSRRDHLLFSLFFFFSSSFFNPAPLWFNFN